MITQSKRQRSTIINFSNIITKDFVSEHKSFSTARHYTKWNSHRYTTLALASLFFLFRWEQGWEIPYVVQCGWECWRMMSLMRLHSSVHSFDQIRKYVGGLLCASESFSQFNFESFWSCLHAEKLFKFESRKNSLTRRHWHTAPWCKKFI